MATPNYGYEKRQKELAKKRKQEDKLKLKAARKSGGGDGAQPDDAQPNDPGAPESAPPEAPGQA